ncbi:hypothetical protein F5882DRAFT_43297 [Hyaloscypha sp. PMI_1271]|nr:hypothetical protein F5882DRAFT_43297 [Hyaloscypha sp. PMI_1271]
MANPIKVHKHAPYRKTLLIPLWTIQLPLSAFLFVMSGIRISTATRGYNFHADLTGFGVVHMLLNLFLASSVIFVIVKFANFALVTHVFKIQSIAAVVVGVICTVLYFVEGSFEKWIMAAFSGTALLASITICARVCVLRRRVKRGKMGEMKRGSGGKELDSEKHLDVELEDGNKFRLVDDGKVGASVKVTLGPGLGIAKPRPSFNSVGTGTSRAPEKVVREFV